MPATKQYCYQTPRWAVALLCAISVAVSVTCFIAAYRWYTWGGNAPSIIRWLLLLMGLGFAVAGARPRNCKPWRYFVADAKGISFPSECPETCDTQWLRIPWTHVGEIKKTRFYDRYAGVLIELIVDDEAIKRFFRDVKLKRMFFGHSVRETGYFEVGYSNAFVRADDAVKVLNRIKTSCS